MAQRTVLKAKGLYTDPNRLSSLPEGALLEAEDVVINRDNVIEPRRGFNQYGNTFGITNSRTKQLLVYKDRILFHEDDNLYYNSNPHNNTVDGNFQQFDGSFSELETGLRIKSVESNKNLFFTTNDGIKKISAKTADDFTTFSGFIRDAGAAKALDVVGSLNSTVDGFLPPNSEVSYRVVWGYKDRNDNLIYGSPSSRLVMSNASTSSANIDLEFVIPQNITSDYFYQIYRSAVFTATGNLTLDDIDPGDELQLVIEDFPTSAELLAGIISVTDLAPEDFRQGGLPLYTNPNSGDGIDQSNEPPPKAKDVAMYQNTVFYANTENRARTTITLLGVGDLVSGVSSITIDNSIDPAQTYTFVGEKEITNIDFTSYAGVIPAALDGKYFLINSASDKRKYYVWYDNTKTEQIIDFTNYIGTIPADLKEKFFVLHTKDADRKYYIWYDSTGSDIDPGTNPNNGLIGYAGIKVDISVGITTTAQVATATSTEIGTNDIDDDFDVSVLGSIVTVNSESFDDTQFTITENILKGFSFTFNTPVNSNPANDLITNTDVVGRIPFRVNVSRNITTTDEVADATAAAILAQDDASDFDVAYTTTNDYLDITNTNNGDTTDASDSLIGANQIANGFSITVTQQGDGEDSLNNEVLLSAAISPAQQIDETARSLVKVINRNLSETVYAFYISGANDLPGKILLETKDIGVNQFTVVANNSATGGLFNPSLPPYPGAVDVKGEVEIKPNRVYYAKLQQPEAVPSLNFIDVGPEDKAILRILALRESLFILKQDGVYRLTGLDGNYTVDLFDESTKIIAPDTAVVLNNQIFCLTNLGMATITDTGVSIITGPIAGEIQLLSSSSYDYTHTSFGVSYENEYSYYLFLPSSKTDTVATKVYRYSTETTAFTSHKLSKICGIVNPGDDKMYLGPSDKNFIERERKNFNRTDYADRDFELLIPTNSVDGVNLKLSSLSNVEVGDAIVQSQYLTISEYNQLLKKLDLDPSLGEAEITRFDYTTYIGTIPTNLHGKYFILYAASDVRRYAVFYDAQGDLTSLDTSVYNDIIDAIQVRVDISSGITTLADVALATKTAIQSSCLDFVVNHIIGNTYFDTTTIKHGETSDAIDSAVNGLNNGFNVTILNQGMGNYFSDLQASQGDNLASKLVDLSTKLDLDPGVSQNDFISAISVYSAIGSTITLGNPTIITQVSHGLQNGRIVTITNSTSTPNINGTYSITKINNNQFSINAVTTVGGTCNWSANLSTFQEIQGGFNTIVKKLNDDILVSYQNYPESSGVKEYEVLIIEKALNATDIITQFSMPFIEGSVRIYKSINCNIIYAPETFGDTSILKQVQEATVIFEDNNFSRASVGFRTDLSPGFEEIDFDKSGKGDFGFFIFSQHNWGGGFSGIPLRTYIPRQKQRCRYIELQFSHNSAREAFILYGFSYTYRMISERAYRG